MFLFIKVISFRLVGLQRGFGFHLGSANPMSKVSLTKADLTMVNCMALAEPVPGKAKALQTVTLQVFFVCCLLCLEISAKRVIRIWLEIVY